MSTIDPTEGQEVFKVENPYESTSKRYDLYERYNIPVITALNFTSESNRKAIAVLVEMYTDNISKLAKLTLRQLIVRYCISMVPIKYLLGKMIQSSVALTFISINNYMSKYKISDTHRREVLLTSYLEDLESVDYQNNTSMYVPKQQKQKLKRGLRQSTPKTKTNLKNTRRRVTFDQDSTMGSILEGSIKGEGNSDLETEMESFQLNTVMDFINYYSGLNLARIFNTSLNESVEDAVAEQRGSILSKKKKTYTSDKRGQFEQIQDRYSDIGVHVTGGISELSTDKALLTLPTGEAEKLAVASTITPSWKQDYWSALVPTLAKKSRVRPYVTSKKSEKWSRSIVHPQYEQSAPYLTK